MYDSGSTDPWICSDTCAPDSYGYDYDYEGEDDYGIEAQVAYRTCVDNYTNSLQFACYEELVPSNICIQSWNTCPSGLIGVHSITYGTGETCRMIEWLWTCTSVREDKQSTPCNETVLLIHLLVSAIFVTALMYCSCVHSSDSDPDLSLGSGSGSGSESESGSEDEPDQSRSRSQIPSPSLQDELANSQFDVNSWIQH